MYGEKKTKKFSKKSVIFNSVPYNNYSTTKTNTEHLTCATVIESEGSLIQLYSNEVQLPRSITSLYLNGTITPRRLISTADPTKQIIDPVYYNWALYKWDQSDKQKAEEIIESIEAPDFPVVEKRFSNLKKSTMDMDFTFEPDKTAKPLLSNNSKGIILASGGGHVYTNVFTTNLRTTYESSEINIKMKNISYDFYDQEKLFLIIKPSSDAPYDLYFNFNCTVKIQ